MHISDILIFRVLLSLSISGIALQLPSVAINCPIVILNLVKYLQYDWPENRSYFQCFYYCSKDTKRMFKATIKSALNDSKDKECKCTAFPVNLKVCYRSSFLCDVD